jgi:hypothetical protein
LEIIVFFSLNLDLELWFKLVPKVVIHGLWIAGSQQILVKSETGGAHYLHISPSEQYARLQAQQDDTALASLATHL